MTVTGSGELVKDGVGQLLIETKIQSTGGIRVKDGILGTWTSLTATLNEAFGTNKITIDRRLGGNPQVAIYHLTDSGKYVMNDIEILGAGANPPKASLLETNDGRGFGGTVTSASDFALASGHCNNGSTRGWYYNNVDAPGCTMYLDSCASWGTFFYYGGEINCSINGSQGQYASQIKLFEFEGRGTAVDADLVLGSTTNVFLSAATWAGTNVTLAAGKTLVLNNANNLSDRAALRLGAGSKLSIPNGVKIQVGSCFANGVKIPCGVYTKTSPALNGYLVGDGKLRVGVPGVVVVFR